MQHTMPSFIYEHERFRKAGTPIFVHVASVEGMTIQSSCTIERREIQTAALYTEAVMQSMKEKEERKHDSRIWESQRQDLHMWGGVWSRGGKTRTPFRRCLWPRT